MKNIIAIMTSTLFLAGCGGSGTSPNTPVQQLEIQTRLNDFATLRTDGAHRPPLPVLETSVFRAIAFNGQTLLTEVGTSELQRRLTLIADIRVEVTLTKAENLISGEISNIQDGTGAEFTGILTISNGQVDNQSDPSLDYAFSARISGSLRDEVGRSLDAQGGLNGDFTGSSYDHVRGESLVVLQTSSGSLEAQGSFFADR